MKRPAAESSRKTRGAIRRTDSAEDGLRRLRRAAAQALANRLQLGPTPVKGVDPDLLSPGDCRQRQL